MNETAEPVIPLLPAILGYGTLALWIAILVIAVITLIRAGRLSPATRVIWCVSMIAVPLVGCVAWLLYYGVNRHCLRSVEAT
jgi:hypothetical protein